MGDKLFYQRQWAVAAQAAREQHQRNTEDNTMNFNAIDRLLNDGNECPGCGTRPCTTPCDVCAKLTALFDDGVYTPRLIDIDEPTNESEDAS